MDRQRQNQPTSVGAQTVAKAVHLLKLIASTQGQKQRLMKIAQMAELDKSTAHRLLQRLVHERLLTRNPRTRTYQLGPLLYELGLGALPESNIKEITEPYLRSLARHTGDTVCLVVKSGFETVCLERIVGNHEIQTMTRSIGDRHPAGIGAGGLAILAQHTEQEITTTINTIEKSLTHYQLSKDTLIHQIRLTQERGFALDEGLAASHITAIGKAIKDNNGQPTAAIFVASLTERMTASRRIKVINRLETCVKEIERLQKMV